MKKGQDYQQLQRGGLPIPQYGVFDATCLTNHKESRRLSHLISKILVNGSGKIGVRTEPKGAVSALGGYPHIMPLYNESEVKAAIRRISASEPDVTWWFLVNEAFLEYEWNAVVKVSPEPPAFRRLTLSGEVNGHDNLPLRQAMANATRLKSVSDWNHPDKEGLRASIIRSGIIDQWLEVSAIIDDGCKRIVFWGLR